MNRSLIAIVGLLFVATSAAAPKPRARDLGVPFDGQPGPLNAITDIAGIEVGEVTLISGSGKLKVGEGPVRTGVTAILPRGKNAPLDPVFAAWFAQNGNGELTGVNWVDEGGQLYGPVMITNTHSVGVVRDAVIAWALARYRIDTQDDRWSLPVVGETWDGWLNDIYGFHVKREHVFDALDSARAGAVPEGSVGGGTGMTCYHFKCGTGTASRSVKDSSGDFTVGVLVQANGGTRADLLVAGVPVGRAIADTHPPYVDPATDAGSFIIVVATDAPLLPHQLKRLARRAGMGLARTGSVAGNDSGDIFFAFSTANSGAGASGGLSTVKMLPNDRITPFFQATIEATEEAIINSLVAAETMTGANDRILLALPHDQLRALLKKYNRLGEAKK